MLVRLPNGDVRSIKPERDSCVLFSNSHILNQTFDRTVVIGKFGSFFANDLINEPYGLTFEILGKHLKVVPPRTLQEVGRSCG